MSPQTKNADDTLKRLQSAAVAAGLSVKVINPLHWQITGGICTVNYYPATKRGDTMYVNGTAGGSTGATVEKAMQAARGVVAVDAHHERRRTKTRQAIRIRKSLHKKQNGRCALCGEALALANANIDHRIPLSKGGSRGSDNLQLTHVRCNSRKSDAWPF